MHSVAAACSADAALNSQVTTKTVGENHKLRSASTLKAARFPTACLPTVLATVASILFLAASNAFATVWPSDGTETGHNYPGGSVQWVHNNQAQDGDTITLPSGTFSYTAPLYITKGITLQGNTQVIGAPMTWQTAVDNTIIVDNTPRNASDLIHAVNLTPTQSFRITGITFKGGITGTAAGDGAVHVASVGNAPNRNIRIDHCHFDHLYRNCLWVGGWIYGLADHCLFESTSTTQTASIHHATWGGETNGNGSWADYPYYGTEKFFFIEDSTLVGAGTNATSGIIDGTDGCRYVLRHSFCHNTHPDGHGTEGGPARGMRASEVYDVIFNWDIGPGGQNRSGTHMWHDIKFTGVRPSSGTAVELALYRDMGACGVNGGLFGAADGTSPWDRNDTDGNGHFIEGQPPYLFASGTATASRPLGTLLDSNANWTNNRWVAFSVRHLRLRKGSLITDNDRNTLHYLPYPGTDRGPRIIFNAGDQYQIHRVLTVLDQNGRGKGDLVRVVNGEPINTITNTPFWTHEQVETCFNWNVTYAPTGQYLGFGSERHPQQVEGQEYVNLGAGFPPDTIPQQVMLFYTAAVNGVQFTQTYCYPHRLQGGSCGNPTPTPTPTATPTPTPTPTATPLPTPRAPSNLVATAVGCLDIKLSWKDNSTNETGFKIERSLDGFNFNQINTVGQNVTTYQDHLGTSGLRYYRVRAYNGAGNSPYSNIASADTTAFCATPTPTPRPTATPTPTATPLPTPRAPSNLVATAVGCLDINLSWTDNSNNENGFKIERSVNGGNFSQINIVGQNVTTYQDHLGTSGLRYYRVRAYNGAGNSQYSNIASADTAPFCATPTPTPSPTPTPTPTPTPILSPTPTPTPIPSPTPTPTPSPTSTATPTPTSTPTPTATATVTPTATPTVTPTPSSTPAPTPTATP
jgi:hypothetical protein